MAPTPVFTSKPLGAGKTYTLTLKNSQGYSQKATLTLYPGQSGHDKSTLQSEWASVGGKGSDPCGDKTMSVGGMTDVKVVSETSYVVYGTLSIVNESNGFAAQDMNWQWISNTGQGGWMSAATPGVDTSMVVMGIGYGNGPVCNDIGSGGYIMSPNFQNGNNWGPVPVVFYVGGVYTPNHPQGNMTDVTALTLSASAFGADIRDSNGASVKGVSLPTP
ncbi:hypothetical protein [Sinomonas gamaensis]|uniref:hypothetical protein n=1 Tax=Sinomonas gamaensis TaxID=2565624 RepID=UPI0011096E1B|nr:hypothetical protein [Sinomonas gamaensis]